MKLGAVALLYTLVTASPTWADSRCDFGGLTASPFGNDSAVASDGGIVVGEHPHALEGADPDVLDRSKWVVGSASKRLATPADTIAPGLYVYRPPPNASTWELFDAFGKRLARAKLLKEPPALLEAPAVRRVISATGEERGTGSVTVELGAPAPKDAIALVLTKRKGAAYSWGFSLEGERSLDVYSTFGGCALPPRGTSQARPGETVSLFWVDRYGRRSRVTPSVLVENLPVPREPDEP